MLDWKLFALGSAFFAGLTAVLAKVGVKDISSNLATLIRTMVIIIFLAILVFVRKEWQNPFLLNRKSLIFLVLSGLATGLSWMCYYRALKTGPASLVAPIDKLSLAFVILLSVLFLGERLSFYEWVGSFFIVAGTLIIIFK
ncbi:MAG TPA: EamA family transporter [Candidatus Omnitrophota bacterium]|nr:EamA family transporter [Candidatus Omnitrophota bacterium]HPN88841.1 EamA family transporter [Candidatus Omnitrophota bacterium]